MAWTRAENDWLVAVLEQAPRPWSRETALMWLRMASNLEASGKPFWSPVGTLKSLPGRRLLRAIFGEGWTDWRIRAVMRAEGEWRDPGMSHIAASRRTENSALKAKVEALQEQLEAAQTDQPRANHAPTTGQPVQGSKSLEPQDPTNQLPTTRRPRASTRVFLTTNTSTTTSSEQQQCGLALEGQQAPKPPKPPTHLDRAMEVWSSARGELHEQAMGSKPRPWRPGKTSDDRRKLVKRFMAEVKQEKLGEPLEVLEAVIRWAYLSPRANWLRENSNPVARCIGGRTTLKRMERAEEALAWVQRGQRQEAPKQRRQSPQQPHGSFAERWEREQRANPGRRIVNPFDHPVPQDTP